MASVADSGPAPNGSTESTLLQPCLTGSIEARKTNFSKDAVLAARSAYWNLIQSTKTPEFYGFAKNLLGQDAIAREKGRATAIQYLPDSRTSQTVFPTSQSLQEYLASASNNE